MGLQLFKVMIAVFAVALACQLVMFVRRGSMRDRFNRPWLNRRKQPVRFWIQIALGIAAVCYLLHKAIYLR